MDNKIYWLNKNSRTFLSRGYLEKDQTPEERIRKISDGAEKILGIKGFADKFESYMHKGWYSLSSPVWANFANKRGLPISCNSSYVSDTMENILYKVAETGMLTKHGAGTSAYFGDLRPRGTPISGGGVSSGPVHFMEMFDTVTRVVSQSNVRRGSFAAYLPIEHADVEEFLGIKGQGHPIQDMSFGLTVSDEWMKSMTEGDVAKRKLWAKVIKKRFESGYPYIIFIDTANKNAPQVYKDKGLKINSSNLCCEVFLSTSSEETFVCNLMSINLLHWEEIKKSDAIETAIYFLDAVMSEYIEKTEGIPFLQHANNFAKRQRALGLGTLGWHSFLQSKMIPFESMEAKFINGEIYETMQKKSYAASRELAELFGEPELLKGYGMRNATTMAIAPTTSSSFILGQVSPSIEPLNSNYFVEDSAKGKFTYRNPYLKTLLESKDKDTPEIWKSIMMKDGSVQHLNFLSKEEKDVFKTFGEISQKEIVIQAAQRQKYIDQSQSLNLTIHPKSSPKDVNELMIFAWEQGVKSLYYQRGTNPSQELGRNILNCASCES